MTDLQIRKIEFRFDDTTPFQWLPSHPKFGLMANAISIMAIAFEKFIVTNTRAAIPLIDDPAAAQEAEAFLRQEAQHAKNHRRHVAALVRQYPGLQETVDAAHEAFDRLVETRSLEFRLAYTADLESTFTPLFKVMLDHADELFRPGDDRVASLFLWHFVEEVEHRSSALIVCDAVVKNRYYRTRIARTVFRHVLQVYRDILEGFETHVPEPDRRAQYRNVSPDGMRREEIVARLPLRSSWRSRLGIFPPSTFAPASNREMLLMACRLLLSQLPRHRPARQPLPRFAATWMEHYAAGRDVTRWYTTMRSAG